MFWKFAPSSNIDSLLDKEDLTLTELLNEEEVLQECKGQNPKLIEFLCKKENIEDLVDMVTLEPEEDENEAIRYKFPSLACELLTSDVSQINDALGDSEIVRKKLFSFLDRETPVNSLLASFFSKVVGILLSRKPEPTLDYIKSQEDFLASVLKHLGTSAIMDLLLRMVTCVEAADLRAQVLSWLNDNQLVQRLIGLIDPAFDEERHCNSAQSLCDIIRLSREHMYTMQESAQEDPLLNTLEREETVSLLLHHMFDGELVESVIVNGISILLALLEIRRPAPFGFPEAAPELTQLDVERLARGVSRTLHGVSGRLADFHNLLLHPPKQEVMKCTFGDLEPPLGNTRLHVCKLLSAILMTNTHNINSQLADLKIFDSLLDLFFKYEYNNFLHTQVSGCIQTVLSNAANISSQPVTVKQNSNSDEGSNPGNDEEEFETENPRIVAPLLAHLFEECRVIQRIMDAWEDNHRHENDDGGHRKGNMGHLTLITNCIVEGIEKGINCERLKRFLSEMPEEDQGRWQKFVAETLSEMNEKNSKELGGHNPMHFSSDEENDDFRDVPFNTDSSLQQAYTDYQLQQMTSNFIDQFGFTDEDFAEPEEHIKFDKIEHIDFDIKGDTNMPSEQLFEAVCKARVAHLDDNFDDEDVEHSDKTFDAGDHDSWEDRSIAFADDIRGSPGSKTISTTPTVTVRRRSDSGSSTGSSENSESPVGSPTPNAIKVPDAEDMDTSQSPGWKANFDEESFEDSSSSSNNSTPTSSPRVGSAEEDSIIFGKPESVHPMDVGQDSKVDEVVISSSANNDENWADFDKFATSTGTDVISSSEVNEEQVTSQEPISAYSVADSTSKDGGLEDLDAGSPMAVTYQHSPGEATEGSTSSIVETPESTEKEAVSSSNEPNNQRQTVQDVDMDDVSSTPDFQLTETEVRDSQSPIAELETQGNETPSSSSSATLPTEEQSILSTVAMDTEPSSTDESEVKRLRMETQEQQRTHEADSSGSREEQNTDGRENVTSSNSEENLVGVIHTAPDSNDGISSSDATTPEETSGTSQASPDTPNIVSVPDSVAEADTASSGDDDRLAANNTPDTSTVVNSPDTSTPDSGVETQFQDTESLASPPQNQESSDYVQHNEVSSSSTTDSKLVNVAETEEDSQIGNPLTPITMNGPV